MANASTVSSKTCSKSLNGKIFQFSSLRISAVCECTEEDKAGLPKYFRHLPRIFNPKICIADYGPLHRALKPFSQEKNLQCDFPKMREIGDYSSWMKIDFFSGIKSDSEHI